MRFERCPFKVTNTTDDYFAFEYIGNLFLYFHEIFNQLDYVIRLYGKETLPELVPGNTGTIKSRNTRMEPEWKGFCSFVNVPAAIGRSSSLAVQR